jgi:hypothetical protein
LTDDWIDVDSTVSEQLQHILLDDLRSRATTVPNMAVHEVPAAILFTATEWTAANGLLNIHYKKMRARLAAHYQTRLETLVSQLAPQ